MVLNFFNKYLNLFYLFIDKTVNDLSTMSITWTQFCKVCFSNTFFFFLNCGRKIKMKTLSKDTLFSTKDASRFVVFGKILCYAYWSFFYKF